MKQRILVVDDETAICQVLGAFLRRQGYETDAVGTLRTAEQKIKENGGYDLIITDLVLTDGCSIDFIKQIKQQQLDTKVIAVTGDCHQAEASLLAQAQKAGADSTATKPFSLSDIKQKVEELCGS